MGYKIFGELEDNGKDANLSLRVSKETRSYFEQHAKSKYGDNATALKDILLNYMETITYKRGTINFNQVYIVLPKIKDMKNIERDYKTDAMIYPTDNNLHCNPCKDLIQLKDSVTARSIYSYIDDYNHYDEIENQILLSQAKTMGYNEEDFIVVFFYLNNHLDTFNNGSYSISPNNKNGHAGFLMFEFDNILYHIFVNYVIDDTGTLTNGYAKIINGSDAYTIAKNKNNLELAKFIDNYNPNISNIEQDINALKNKREELKQQIKEINAQIKILKK